MTITANEWLFSERFIYNVLPLLLGAVGVLLLVAIFSLLYLGKGRRKWLIVAISLVLACVIGVSTYMKLATLTTYQGLAKYEAPLNRDRRKKPFSYEFNGEGTPSLIDIQRLDHLPFYDQTAIEEQEVVTYLGKTNYLYYLQIYRKLYSISINSEEIQFSSEVSEPLRRGYTYHLNDPAFEELGFYPAVGPIYYQILIPASEQDKVFQETDKKSELLDF